MEMVLKERKLNSWLSISKQNPVKLTHDIFNEIRERIDKHSMSHGSLSQAQNRNP